MCLGRLEASLRLSLLSWQVHKPSAKAHGFLRLDLMPRTVGASMIANKGSHPNIAVKYIEQNTYIGNVLGHILPCVGVH